jgi:glycosyltransferase involved in cell wall biosynthesis
MDHLVTLSTGKRSACFYDYHLAQRRKYRQLSVIPNGVEIAEIDWAPNSFRSEMNIQTQTMLLCAGNYDEQKNQLGTLEAFLQSCLRDTTLVFIGSEKNDYSDELERVYSEATRKNQVGPVLFCDRLTRSQLFSAYKAADIVVSGSRWECQPLVLLDAMGAGKAFISSDVGCVSEMPGGICVQTTDEMAAAMVQLVQDQDMRQLLGSAGRQACELKYNWIKVVDCYEQLAASLLSSI